MRVKIGDLIDFTEIKKDLLKRGIKQATQGENPAGKLGRLIHFYRNIYKSAREGQEFTVLGREFVKVEGGFCDKGGNFYKESELARLVIKLFVVQTGKDWIARVQTKPSKKLYDEQDFLFRRAPVSERHKFLRARA